jgi:hypothetical protein
MTRSANDWGALVLAELRGDEQPGTVATLVAEATGHPPATDVGGETKGLLRILELLHSPTDLKKRIADLDRSATAATAAERSAKAEQAKLAKAKQDLAAEREKHQVAIAHEVRDHQSAMARASAELSAVQRRAAELKSKAEFDAATAAKDKAEVQRRLRAMEGAAA